MAGVEQGSVKCNQRQRTAVRTGMLVTKARQQAQCTAAGLRTQRQRGSGLGQHRQWVALGSGAARIRAWVTQVHSRAGIGGSANGSTGLWKGRGVNPGHWSSWLGYNGSQGTGGMLTTQRNVDGVK